MAQTQDLWSAKQTCVLPLGIKWLKWIHKEDIVVHGDRTSYVTARFMCQMKDSTGEGGLAHWFSV